MLRRSFNTSDDRPKKPTEETTTIEDSDLQPIVASQLLCLADLLDGAADAQWETPSLCEGWRIREVIAHVTMAARYSDEAFMAELADCEYDFPRLSNLIAGRDAELPTAELVANLRSDTMLHWAPPGGGFHGALNHAVIHSLDVTVPLDVPRLASDEAIGVVLDDLCEGGAHEHFGIDISERHLEATDLEWSYGSGPVLRAEAADLALMICGRTVPEVRVKGEPLGRLPSAG